MFEGSGAHELGYANAAVLVALLRMLVRQEVLTQSMAEDVLRDGIDILKPTAMIDSVSRAQRFIESAFGAALKEKMQ
jgi:hypothetical protein